MEQWSIEKQKVQGHSTSPLHFFKFVNFNISTL